MDEKNDCANGSKPLCRGRSVISVKSMYQSHPHHRNGNRRKSQWTISVPEEVAAFNYALSEGWLAYRYGWGVHLVNGIVSYLGVAQDRCTALFLAKFVCDPNGNDSWHGYPADYRNNPQDIPDEDLCFEWLAVASWIQRKLDESAKASLAIYRYGH